MGAYDGGHDFAMHGPDKEFYDELVSTVASGVVGRGMYDAAGSGGGAAGDGDVAVGGGADSIRQALAAGKLDELSSRRLR